MSRFIETESEIRGVFTVSKKRIGDERGYLERVFCTSELRSWSARKIAQVNKTFTKKKGTVRGFHFQHSPYAEAKFICCLRGKIMDFALDLRSESSTFGSVFSVELDAALHNAILLPEGVAHGFQTLSDNVEMLYFHSEPYTPAHEAGINILDPSLGVNLPLNCSVISDRDYKFPNLSEFKGVLV